MKKQLLHIIGAALLAAVVVHAQTTQKLIVNVPFSFSAGKTILSPGEYTVNLAVAPGALGLQSADHKSTAVVMGISAESREKHDQAKLIFKRYGDQYFLSQVWPASSGIGREIPPTSREREAALSAAVRSEVVVLARASQR
jgi:hypothetical protein